MGGLFAMNWKRIIATTSILICIFSLGGCKNREEQQILQEDVESVVDVQEIQNVKMPSENGAPFYIYSWNDELGERLKYFEELYPQYKNRLVYINMNLGSTSNEYITMLETMIQNGPEQEECYPSMVALDENIALEFIRSENTIPIEEVGISDKELSDMYQFTLDYASYNQQVKALTWQTNPGVVCYRTDIAKEVLGTSDPIEIQKEISNWDGFFSTANKMKEAGYKMISGPDDIKFPYYNMKEEPWVLDGNLNMDAWISDYLTVSKNLHDGDFTSNTSIESDAWFSNMDKDVFCYFGNAKFFYWQLDPTIHAEDYALCKGPTSYHWGGTYLSVTSDCVDKDFAALVLRTLCCDESSMKKIYTETNDFVNNKEVIKELIADESVATPLSIFHSVANEIDVSNVTPYDMQLNFFVDEITRKYNVGMIVHVEDAKEELKKKVKEYNPYIHVE